VTGNFDAVFMFLIAATVLALVVSLSIRLSPETNGRLAAAEEA
jgi:hypothetical protein